MVRWYLITCPMSKLKRHKLVVDISFRQFSIFQVQRELGRHYAFLCVGVGVCFFFPFEQNSNFPNYIQWSALAKRAKMA